MAKRCRTRGEERINEPGARRNRKIGHWKTKGHSQSIPTTIPFTVSLDHVYAIMDRNLYRPPKPMKGDRVRRDIKRNCTFHKNIEHTSVKSMVLMDEIESLIRVGYFKEFVDEPNVEPRGVTSTIKLGEGLRGVNHHWWVTFA